MPAKGNGGSFLTSDLAVTLLSASSYPLLEPTNSPLEGLVLSVQAEAHELAAAVGQVLIDFIPDGIGIVFRTQGSDEGQFLPGKRTII